ncbi:MAG: sodium-translocating pyrophosphatase, partial [Gammaproteobacteria bacterium]|nr:sodium-translocating pyrophosphatase [Gammaproteobacteria bacterium]
METINSLPPIMGVLGLVCAVVVYVLMTRYDEGGEKIGKIADAIHEGAMTFLHREYMMLALFTGPLFLIIF